MTAWPSPRPGSVADQRRSDRERRLDATAKAHIAYARALLRGEHPDPPGAPTLFDGDNIQRFVNQSDACDRCRHPRTWHRLDDALNVGAADPAARFRCLGYDPEADGPPSGTCTCGDYVPPAL